MARLELNILHLSFWSAGIMCTTMEFASHPKAAAVPLWEENLPTLPSPGSDHRLLVTFKDPPFTLPSAVISSAHL